MFHKYADCVWDSAKEAGTFWKGKEICEEEGGQLMSFEKFPTEEEFIDYVSKLRFQTTYVGFIRNGSKSDFKWFTGTTLERSSFFWGNGEPNNNHLDLLCGNIYRGKLDDFNCQLMDTKKILLPNFPALIRNSYECSC
ncbi:hypothetical protein Avbf_10480 [Armadillidium vulgare]|nr:hypothetical protein Avbf_10480 [Armadillidium vulgare]